MRPLAAGNYFPLTDGGHDPRGWQGLSFVAPDRSEGVAIFFRREACPFDSGHFPLRGLDPEKTYAVDYVDEGAGENGTLSGRELMDKGLSVTLAEPRSGAVVFVTAR